MCALFTQSDNTPYLPPSKAHIIELYTKLSTGNVEKSVHPL